MDVKEVKLLKELIENTKESKRLTEELLKMKKEEIKSEYVVKSVENIIKILREDGYEIDKNGDWMRNGAHNFLSPLFYFCGKPPSPKWKWESKWLEEKPEYDFSKITTEQLKYSTKEMSTGTGFACWGMPCGDCPFYNTNCNAGAANKVKIAFKEEWERR